MNKHLLITLFSFQSVFSQLPNGSIAPDFTLIDIHGSPHTLYDYTDQGYTVFIDFSAVWCGPCWGYHTSGALEDLYINHGPSGMANVSVTTTDDVMVFFIEGDGNPISCLQGTGCGTQGDWVAGTPYPIICTDGTVNSTGVTSAYSIGYWPTVYQVCPSRILTECGQTASPYALITSCLPPPSSNNDARSFMDNSASSGCSSVTPEITIQNYGLNNLTSVIIDVSVNGVFQYSSTFDEVWSNATNQYEPLNLNTLDIENVQLDPITGLVNNDIITIDVSLPNGVVDTDPSNNGTITFVVNLGFDNAYWDGLLSIDVSGATNVNSWYLKKVSNNQIIASGWGGVTGATNAGWPLEFNECYTLQSINGSGESYTITDGAGQIILQGTVSGVEDFDNFTTGDELWTGVEDISNSNNIYPNPVQDNLFIEGTYDYVEISDLLGRSLLISENKNVIDISQLSSGIYIVNIQSYNTKTSHKIQVTR